MSAEHSSSTDATPLTVFDFKFVGSKGKPGDDFEPRSDTGFRPTDAVPGSEQKLEEMARRVREGLPLWHEEDRRSYDDTSED
jgi:hypothetical protein